MVLRTGDVRFAIQGKTRKIFITVLMMYYKKKGQSFDLNYPLTIILSFFLLLIIPVIMPGYTVCKQPGTNKSMNSGLGTKDRAQSAEGPRHSYKTLWQTSGLPDGPPLKRPQGCCLDTDSSLIYVADTDNDRVMIFGTDGHAVGQFYTSRPLKRPYDLVIGNHRGSAACVYISRISGKTIEVFDKEGIWLSSISNIPKEKNGKEGEFAPGRMAFDRQGNLLFIDRSTGIVWGMTGKDKGIQKLAHHWKEKKSLLLTGITLGPEGKIYVSAAQGSPVVTVMDPQGVKVSSFGRHGALYDDSFSFPSSLAADSEGRIFIVDAFRHSIKVFSPEGRYLFHIGLRGRVPGMFIYPVDIAVDPKGIVYVLEKGAGRLQALSLIDEKAE